MGKVSTFWITSFVYIYMCVCVCVFVENERGERERERERERAMGKVSSFWINNFVHTLCFFQVLSTVQQTKVSFALSVRENSTMTQFTPLKICKQHALLSAFIQKLQYEDFRLSWSRYNNSVEDSKRGGWVLSWLRRYGNLEASL